MLLMNFIYQKNKSLLRVIKLRAWHKKRLHNKTIFEIKIVNNENFLAAMRRCENLFRRYTILQMDFKFDYGFV